MVRLYEIRLGDRRHIRQGWLILSEGAVRGLLLSGDDDGILFGLAFDRRIRPLDEMMVFRDLAEAQAWMEKRLAPVSAPSEA
jgi:hypothetical protein